MRCVSLIDVYTSKLHLQGETWSIQMKNPQNVKPRAGTNLLNRYLLTMVHHMKGENWTFEWTFVVTFEWSTPNTLNRRKEPKFHLMYWTVPHFPLFVAEGWRRPVCRLTHQSLLHNASPSLMWRVVSLSYLKNDSVFMQSMAPCNVVFSDRWMSVIVRKNVFKRRRWTCYYFWVIENS